MAKLPLRKKKSHQILTAYLSLPPSYFRLLSCMQDGTKRLGMFGSSPRCCGSDNAGKKNEFFQYLLSFSLALPHSLDIKSAFMHLAEPWVLNYLGPVPPSAFHSNQEYLQGPQQASTRRQKKEKKKKNKDKGIEKVQLCIYFSRVMSSKSDLLMQAFSFCKAKQ